MNYWWLPLEIAGLLLTMMAGVKLIEWAGHNPRLARVSKAPEIKVAPSKPRECSEDAPSTNEKSTPHKKLGRIIEG